MESEESEGVSRWYVSLRTMMMMDGCGVSLSLSLFVVSRHKKEEDQATKIP